MTLGHPKAFDSKRSAIARLGVKKVIHDDTFQYWRHDVLLQLTFAELVTLLVRNVQDFVLGNVFELNRWQACLTKQVRIRPS
jgi:hypothetical protein